jgi:hypothetical protein
MPVLLHGIPERLPPRIGAGEDLQHRTAVIVEPLDAPLAGGLAIFKDFGWFRQGTSSVYPGRRLFRAKIALGVPGGFGDG